MNQFVKKLLMRYKIQFFSGMFLAILLGIFSVVISSLAGPSLKILTDQSPQNILWKNLFGETLGLFLSKVTGVDSVYSTQLIVKLPIFLVAFAFFKALTTALQWSLFENLGEKVSRDIRKEIGEKFIHAGYENLNSVSSQEDPIDDRLASAVGNDTRLLREYIVHFWGGLPREGFQTILQAIFLVLLSPKLFLFFLTTLIPIILILAQLGRKIRKRVKKMLTDFSSLTEWLQQRLLGIETIKQFKTESFECEKFSTLSYDLSQKALATERVKATTAPLVELMGLLGFAGVLMLALHFSNQSQIPGSVLLSFFTALALFAQAVGNLGRYFNSNREAKEAVLRLNALIKSLDAASKSAKISSREISMQNSAAIKLEINNLAFNFGQKNILQNFSKTLCGGKIYGIAGPSGSGKSTLMKILLGLLAPKEGNINYFSHGGDLNYSISYVPQNMSALEGSIAENIAYPHFAINEDLVWQALDKVKMHDYVKGLKSGVQTAVNFAGFSGGQLQRIFFARIFYLASAFIFIDEGTSAQDPAHEQIILDALTALKNSGCCIVMIAHREKVKMFCDELIYLGA